MSPLPPLLTRRTWTWLGLMALVLLLLWVLAPVLSPFLVAGVLAYALHPLVVRLTAWRVPHLLAVLCVEAMALAAMLGLFFLLVPVLLREWPVLRDQLPGLLDRLDESLRPLLAAWGWQLPDVRALKPELIAWLREHREDWLAPVWSSLKVGGSALMAWLGYVVLVPVVLFFALHDWARLTGSARAWVPPRWQRAFDGFLLECDGVLGQYLRGQALVMVVLAVYYSVGLYLFGLDLAVQIGVFTGLAVFVPYLGFGLGLVLALLVGLLHMPAGQALTMVVVVYGLGQILESWFLTPRLVGERIGLHPLAVILALLVFGQWLGFAGVLLALPVSAVLLVALRRARSAYLASALYRDEGGGGANP